MKRKVQIIDNDFQGRALGDLFRSDQCPFKDCNKKIEKAIIFNGAKTKIIVGCCKDHTLPVISAVKANPNIINEWNLTRA
jgi:hypothetical protein